jgi:hypothetical protein
MDIQEIDEELFLLKTDDFPWKSSQAGKVTADRLGRSILKGIL